MYLAFKIDSDGNIGFGYVADEFVANMLHRAASNAQGDLKELFASAKAGDLTLTMGKYELNENEDGVSGEFIFKVGGKSKARIEYSKLTTESVMFVVISTPEGMEESVSYSCEFKTPAALGIEVGNVIDITTLG